MDALKAEIALKRKALDVPVAGGRPSKYLRRGDIERMKEEQEQKAREEKESKDREKAAETSAMSKVSLIALTQPHPEAHLRLENRQLHARLLIHLTQIV